MDNIVLQGITWGHSRGYTPLVAFSQRFSELHPGVEIRWRKRSLQQFADYPIEVLARQYDLLIIDHPWVGCAAATNTVLPLDEYLPQAYLQAQRTYSVGQSHDSYFYNGHQWALAIDAATPVASYRADLLQVNNYAVPQTWNDVLQLAAEGKVAVPAIPIDLLMNFYTFCIAHGTEPFATSYEVIDLATGTKALQTMRQLYALVHPSMFSRNPIAVAELMTTTNDYWYCPFAYGYSNYSRNGYAASLLHYTLPVTFRGLPLQTTIGGTGIAVSATSQHTEWATRFAMEICSATCQSTFYVEHGGQPGHLCAWESPTANQLTNHYFTQCLPAMRNGYMRPRYNGYLHFQDTAGLPLQQYLQHGGSETEVLQQMNRLYAESFHAKPQPV